MSEILRNVFTGFADWPWLDQVNFLLGVIGVCLMIYRSLWAFPVGLISVTVQGILFWKYTFYADSVLQGFFFVFLAYGWWHWVRHKGSAPELPVTSLSWKSRGGYLLGAVVFTLAWGWWQSHHTDAKMPYRDAYIAAFSVVGQLLQVRKNLENWLVWVLVNSVAIASYWSADLAFTAFLYLIYLVLAFAGWREWLGAMRKQTLSVEN